MVVVCLRMYLQQVRSCLGEGRRRWFPRSGDTGAGGNVLVLTAELVACARGSSAGTICDSMSVIIVANLAVIIVVVIVIVTAIVIAEARGGRARRRATTTTSTATDTTTANAVDLHHFAVDRSRRLGSTRRGRDAATDHHHQTISPPPPPHSATAPPFSCSSSTVANTPRLSSNRFRFAFNGFFLRAARDLSNADECLGLTYHLAILSLGVQRLIILLLSYTC